LLFPKAEQTQQQTNEEGTAMSHKYRALICLLAASPILVAFTSPLEVTQQEVSVQWWVWIIVVLVLLILLVWWWSRRAEAPEPAATMEQIAPDDLKRIEGIGPKISGLFQAAGIATFAKLASTDASHLLQIVRDAGITIADPTTWPEQAALAAEGKWEQLEALQEVLKGGRRQ
jgi:FtsH-binding integral membrane protein